MESIAEKCKELGMCFTAEEFLDLWTCKVSDCIAIEPWHAPKAFDIVKFIKSQNPKNTSLEEVIDHIKKNFVTEKKGKVNKRLLGQSKAILLIRNPVFHLQKTK